MIKIELTKNYTGLNIEGNFDDFYELYDAISYFIGHEERENEIEEDERLHILGFLYDLRHAYQASREIITKSNGLTDATKEYYGIPYSIKHDVFYAFDYLVTDLILDVLLIKNFTSKKIKELNELNVNYNIVSTFYSKVVEALNPILTDSQQKELKQLLLDTYVTDDVYLRQWYIDVSGNYAKLTKGRRKEELMNIIKQICNPKLYEEYTVLRNAMYKIAKESNRLVTSIERNSYPSNIIW